MWWPLSRRYVLHAFLSACVSRDSIVILFQNYSGLVDDNLESVSANVVPLKSGCGITFRDQMWYFGGGSGYTQQVILKAILQI